MGLCHTHHTYIVFLLYWTRLHCHIVVCVMQLQVGFSFGQGHACGTVLQKVYQFVVASQGHIIDSSLQNMNASCFSRLIN